jgi:hypothetical protein
LEKASRDWLISIVYHLNTLRPPTFFLSNLVVHFTPECGTQNMKRLVWDTLYTVTCKKNYQLNLCANRLIVLTLEDTKNPPSCEQRVIPSNTAVLQNPIWNRIAKGNALIKCKSAALAHRK